MDIQPRRNLGRVLGMKSHINQLIHSHRLTVGNSFHFALRMFDVSSINELRCVFPEIQPLTKLICAFISTCFFQAKTKQNITLFIISGGVVASWFVCLPPDRVSK